MDQLRFCFVEGMEQSIRHTQSGSKRNKKMIEMWESTEGEDGDGDGEEGRILIPPHYPIVGGVGTPRRATIGITNTAPDLPHLSRSPVGLFISQPTPIYAEHIGPARPVSCFDGKKKADAKPNLPPRHHRGHPSSSPSPAGPFLRFFLCIAHPMRS